MKKSIILMSMLASVAMLVMSCNKTEKIDPNAPQIDVQSEYYASYTGGENVIEYKIKNPVEGGVLTPSCVADWVSDVTCDSVSVKFIASPNETDVQRIGELNLHYVYEGGEVSAVVKLTQVAFGEETPIVGPYLDNLSGKTIATDAEGGSFTLRYEIFNEEADGRIEATTDVDWISIISYETIGEVNYTVGKNALGDRTGVITVSYIYNEDEDTVSFDAIIAQPISDQPVTEGGFTIEVTNVSYSSAKITITPENPDMAYLVVVGEASSIQGLSDDEIFRDDLERLESQAIMMGTTLQDYLTLRLITGSRSSTQGALTPNTAYYVYVYGVHNGETTERTTDIAKKLFTTDVLDVTEGSITLEAEITGTTLSAVATPYDNSRYYNLQFNRENTLQGEGYTSGTAAERCYQYELDYMTSYLKIYPPTAWQNVKQGPASTSTTMNVADTYYVFAYFLNASTGVAESDIVIKTVIFDGSSAEIVE
ncbi:MAG TPA: hypothetical protein IAC04_00045 [Candidatus Coprenecus stercoravium]|uniref:Lipoprotein n=1 Tax=Candidatus Coprenecus stercoravium TaxID=2840735 RepID=A0A9D2K7Z4_9BACT|nr:hypothetical protein [Candidatus Coprenecus stercoravium]